MPSPPALVTSAASIPPATPAIGADRIGRRHENALVKGVFHIRLVLLAMLMLVRLHVAVGLVIN